MRRDKFDLMLNRNYELHGWNKDGIPEIETIKKLGLLDLID